MPRLSSLTGQALLNISASSVLTLLHTLDNPNAYSGQTADKFGQAVAIGDTYAIVGVPGESGPDGFPQETDHGVAYIFNIKSGELVHTLDNPDSFSDGSSFDNFGYNVAINDDYAVVQARLEDDSDYTSIGVIYVFDTVSGNLIHTIANPGNGDISNQLFGDQLALDGSILIASRSRYNVIKEVHAFDLSQTSPLTPSFTLAFDSPSDWSAPVAISNNYILTADESKVETVDGTDREGVVYIYSSTGIFLRKINNPVTTDQSSSHTFGRTLSISVPYAVIGNPYTDNNGTSRNGRVEIFNITDGSFVRTIENPYDAEGTLFGKTLSASGGKVAIHAQAKESSTDNPDDYRSGVVYIYSISTGSLIHQIDNPNPDGITELFYGDEFGDGATAIHKSHGIFGARGEDGGLGKSQDPGKAYIYSF